ncbi:ABC transporter ATP-binding protein [Paenibacillus sp. FSL R10-2796]|uniref:ABC transporter ATP-binding protein n=1 Tax=Paenibacillus sp. FSL R10-2796 TaxID=2954663 RepID=UPI0030DB505B
MELKLCNIVHDFGKKRILNTINLSMSPGVYGLLGPNGTGKTTLMRIVADILYPTRGNVLLDGQNKDDMGDQYRAQIGYLPQELGMYNHFSARDFLYYVAALKGLTKKEASDRIEVLAQMVNLSGEMDKKCGKYSGGMKRRLGIAQALLNNPGILILDEPTAGLDPSERVRFRNLISEISNERIVILSTHIVSDVDHIAKQVLLMGRGELLRQGTIKELINELQGEVWEAHVPGRLLAQIEENGTVVNVQQTDTGLVVRVVSKTLPVENALMVNPSLEDVYMHYFRRG